MSKEGMNARYFFRCEQEFKEMVKRAAEDHKMSESRFIRLCVYKQVAKGPVLRDAGRAALAAWEMEAPTEKPQGVFINGFGPYVLASEVKPTP